MTTLIQIRHLILTTLLFSAYLLIGQSEEPSGLLGDNFSLETALEEFKKAKSLEAFEKAINDEKNHVHNLDLNGDNDIDYIRVNDHTEDGVHAIVLSSVISKDESQDIAVIEIEKDGEKSAKLQIVGDVDLYGEDMIVEPYDMSGESDGQGPDGSYEFSRIVINVWGWPSVRYIYGPSYVVYHSPWRWSYYPTYWRPWRPLAWSFWHPYRTRHVRHYHVSPVRRVTHAHRVYTPHRSVSRTVTVKHKTSVTKARSHKVTSRKSTTKVAGVKTKNGKAVAAKKTTTTKNSNGVKKSTSKTKVKATNGKKSVKASKTTKKKSGKKGGKKGVKKSKKVKKKKG